MTRTTLGAAPAAIAVAAAALALTATPAAAQTPGLIEDFNNNTQGFGGAGTGPDAFMNTGGVGGENDAYWRLSRDVVANFGGFASGSSTLVGDYIAAGVTGVSFYLNELEVDDGTEMHVAVGNNFSNVWIYTVGFDADADTWTQFTVDFTDTENWVQIIGGGTFENALANADRLLFRHDLAPFVRNPDPIQATIGIDRIRLLPTPSTAAAFLAAGAFAARRRRARGA